MELAGKKETATHTCPLCVPTIVEVSFERLFGVAVVLC